MENKIEKSRDQVKKTDFERERDKLLELFEITDESEKKLVEGLIDDAAFIRTENTKLREIMKETGMVRIHPDNVGLQKPLEVSKQYGRNVNTYATVIKTLNSILHKSVIEEEDTFDKWIQERDRAKQERNK